MLFLKSVCVIFAVSPIVIFVVFRQGDIGTNWYAVLSGSLNVNVSETGNLKVSQTIHHLFNKLFPRFHLI